MHKRTSLPEFIALISLQDNGRNDPRQSHISDLRMDFCESVLCSVSGKYPFREWRLEPKYLNINGILPQTKAAGVSACSLQEQWSHVMTAEMNFFSSCEHLLSDTTNVSQGGKNMGGHGVGSIVATGPAPACRKGRICQPFVIRGARGRKSQLPKADRRGKRTILDKEDDRKRGRGRFQTLSN